MIQALHTDCPEIEAFLAPQAERVMFPLSNLLQYGMSGGHPHAVTMWYARRDGMISDILTLTDAGMVMPCLPSGEYPAAAGALVGRNVAGIVGVKDWARGLEAAAGLATAIKALYHDEPHFLLELPALTLPEGRGHIVPLLQAPAPIIKTWMLDYQLSTLQTPADQAALRVEDSYANYAKSRSHVVLMDGATPLAMTGFNAQLPDIVQVGAVYTPPDLRGQGHARRAVALHLAGARQRGVQRATLFSASDMAARAYRAIGFQQIGQWALILLRDKEMVARHDPDPPRSDRNDLARP